MLTPPATRSPGENSWISASSKRSGSSANCSANRCRDCRKRRDRAREGAARLERQTRNTFEVKNCPGKEFFLRFRSASHDSENNVARLERQTRSASVNSGGFIMRAHATGRDRQGAVFSVLNRSLTAPSRSRLVIEHAPLQCTKMHQNVSLWPNVSTSKRRS